MKDQVKHKLCRRIGSCIWGSPKCPSVKRPYPAGKTARGRQQKLSTYGQLLLEKQKLKTFYAVSEKQLRLAYQKAKRGEGMANEKLLKNLELRLDALVYRCGFAPSIYAAKQFVNHRHIKVDGKKVDRSSYKLKPGQVISISADKSPSIANIAKNTNCEIPAYLEVDRENLKATLEREPLIEEIPCTCEVMRVIEYYAR
ncbi:MAG: 30S ribosomal protein S4, partial [Victivallales bacterium]|nr:30S ribosomal protein S4 [Victivallales bacterium]